MTTMPRIGISVAEAARRLSLKSAPVLRMCESGEIAARKVNGRWIVDAEELPDFVPPGSPTLKALESLTLPQVEAIAAVLEIPGIELMLKIADRTDRERQHVPA